jgi:WD40 repeat protein
VKHISERGLILNLLGVAMLPYIAVAQSKELTPPMRHNSEITSAQFSSNDALLVTASTDGITKLWDAESGKIIRAFGIKQEPNPNFMAAISTDGELVATINGRGGRVWNTKYGDLAFQLLGYGDTLKAVHFSKNSKWIITASLDGIAKLWDANSGKHHHMLDHSKSLQKEDFGGVTEAKFCNQDKWLITGSNKLIEAYMLPDSTKSSGKTKAPDLRGGMKKFSTYDSSAIMWDLKSGKIVHAIVGYPIDVSYDGKFIITGSETLKDNSARVWDVVTGKLIRTLKGINGRVTSCEFSHDEKKIITLSRENGICKMWDASTGSVVFEVKAGQPNSKMTAHFSEDSKWIATFSGDSSKTWDAASGKLLYAVACTRPITFSNQGKTIVVVNGKQAVFCEGLTGKPIVFEGGRKKYVKIR